MNELGLPPTWKPTAVNMSWAKVRVEGPAGPVDLTLMILDTPLGRLAYAFDADGLQRLIDQATAQSTGLTIARHPLNGAKP